MALKISGDSTECTRCGKTWDTNDPNPPKHCDEAEKDFKVYYKGVPMGTFKARSGPESVLAALAHHRHSSGPKMVIGDCKAELVGGGSFRVRKPQSRGT